MTYNVFGGTLNLTQLNFNYKVTCQCMVLISEQFPVNADTACILVLVPDVGNHVTQCLPQSHSSQQP